MSREVELPGWARCLERPYRHIALYGGRGAGKSHSVALALVLQAARAPLRVLCAREVQRSIRDSVKRLLDDQIERAGLRAFYESTDSEIRGRNGSLFIFTGLKGNAAGVRSIEGVDVCWIEEAATVSQSSIETLIPTIRAKGSRVIWTWNPDLETDPVDAMFRGGHLDQDTVFSPPPHSHVQRVNHDENPWFPDELRGELEYDRSRDYDKYLHVWEGEYRRNSEARVFKNWRVEAFESDPSAEYRLGADFGFSIDPSCLVRCYIVGRTIFVDYESYGLNVEIVNLPALFMCVPEAEKFWITADSSRPETISHLRRNGFPRIAPAIKGTRSVEEGVEFLKSYDIIVHPRCQHTIDELTHYSYKVDSLTGQVTAVLADKDNHLIDALRYAVEGARRALTSQTDDSPVTIPTLALRR